MLAQVSVPPEYSAWRGEQYMDTGWFGVAFTLGMVFLIAFNIVRAHRKSDIYIRRIAGLNAIDEAIGRATEMGRPIVMVPGIGPIGPIVFQALSIFASVTKTAAQFGTPIRLYCSSGPVLTVAQEIIRDTYQTQGVPERYDPDSVRFLSDQQFAFAAGVSGLMLREKVAAAFFLGDFFAESLIFAETANAIGAIQVAGSTQATQTPFFIAACDYVLIGEEFYVASAYITREPVLLGSIVGQDWMKIAVSAMVLGGSLIGTWQIRPGAGRDERLRRELMRKQPDLQGAALEEALRAYPPTEAIKIERTLGPRLFTQDRSVANSLKIVREPKVKPAETPAEAGGEE